jgi:hypothetical protein
MRVVVLGAGASVHVGYPLTKDLCPKLLEWAETNEPAGQLHWPDRNELSEFGSLVDLEELVSQVEKAQKPGPILEGLRNAVCGYFDSIRANEAALYRTLAQQAVQLGDVLVSFNYDVSLDRELRRSGKWNPEGGYGFDLGIDRFRSDTRLLKLHGSTNWMDSLFDGLRAGQVSIGFGDSHGARPVLLPQEFNFLEYPEMRDPRFNGGGLTRNGSMVLPSRNKRFCVKTSSSPNERENFWSHLWDQAADALVRADEIVIIGYSLPVADERARNLLLEPRNCHASVTVCCKRDSDRIGREFRRAGFDKVCSNLEGFENWLDAVISARIKQGEASSARVA